MEGQEVKKLILDSGLYIWQVAEKFGLSANHFSVRLRHEFSPEEVDRIKSIIKKLST